LQQTEPLHHDTDRDAAYGDHDAGDKALAGGEEEPVDYIFFEKQTSETHDDFGRGGNDETVEQSAADKGFDDHDKSDK
jgi:hypothetical protein